MSPSHAGQPLLSSCCPAGSPAPAPASEGAGDLGSVPRWPPSPQQARASPSLTQTSGRPLPAPPMAAVPPCPQLWALPAWCICTEHLRAHLCPLAGVSVREGASSLATSAGVAAAVLRVPPLSPQASLRWAAQAQQGWTETSCLLPGHSHTHILYFLPISTLRGSCENSTGHAPTPTFESQLVTQCCLRHDVADAPRPRQGSAVWSLDCVRGFPGVPGMSSAIMRSSLGAHGTEPSCLFSPHWSRTFFSLSLTAMTLAHLRVLGPSSVHCPCVWVSEVSSWSRVGGASLAGESQE